MTEASYINQPPRTTLEGLRDMFISELRKNRLTSNFTTDWETDRIIPSFLINLTHETCFISLRCYIPRHALKSRNTIDIKISKLKSDKVDFICYGGNNRYFVSEINANEDTDIISEILVEYINYIVQIPVLQNNPAFE
jgi:hypothetical protein